jgi:spore germination protein GerM
MSDPWREDDGPPRRHTNRIAIAIAAAMFLAAAAWLFFAPHDALEPESPIVSGTPDAAEASRPVTLWFGNEEATGLVAEERALEATVTRDERIAAAVRALITGPTQSDAVRTLPEGVQLQRVLIDDENSTVYLDFDQTLVTRHPGGTAAESMTLRSIARTIGANFPGIARVQLLVEGEAVESLAGHVDTSKPLEIAAWK